MAGYPRNQPCPCGSGKKYKACCYTKGYRFERKGGEVQRVVPLNAELQAALDAQRQAFIKKFGREWGPGDPIFFDPDSDSGTPQPINMEVHRRAVTDAMKAAGIADELIYAYSKSGYLLTTENENLIPEEGVRAFREAVVEFREMFGGKEYDHDQQPLRKRGPEREGLPPPRRGED